MDHVVVVDDMHAVAINAATGAEVADDQGAAKEGLEAIIV